MRHGASDAATVFTAVVTPPLRGELILPAGARGALSAVVILNSSAGVCDVRERFYARFLADKGLAALVVDSFGPRGIADTTRDQSLFCDQDMERDAYAAYDFLAADSRFDPARIAVMGVSKGGYAAMNTGLLARRAWFSRPVADFAARVALVPPAHLQQRDVRSDGRPLLVLLAGLDDYTGTVQPAAFVARIRGCGHPYVVTVSYPRAWHAWERPGPPLWLERAENYCGHTLLVEDDGRLTDAADGRRLTLAEFYEARERYRTFGGHAGGGTPALTIQAATDIVRFLTGPGGLVGCP